MFRDDKDFFYGNRRPNLAAYMAVAIFGALIGGFIVLFLGPSLIKNNPGLNENRYNQSLPPIISGVESPVIQIAEKVGPTVVGISNRAEVSFFPHGQNAEGGSGSGVIFTEDGLIVTNYHVVRNSAELVVTLPDGKELPGELIGADARTDLAVVKIGEKGLKAATFGDSDKVRVGELAVAIGNPLGEDLASTVTAGVISALNRTVDLEEQRFRLIQTDAAINPGNSGGALVNSKGEVIGINSIKIVDVNVEGLNFAIPSNTVKPIVDAIIKNGKVIRPWIGILGGDVNQVVVQQYNLAVNKGVLVSDLPPGSPAAKAGIGVGDVIISLNQQVINNFGDLRNTIDKQKIGSKVEIVVMRGKEKKTFSLILEKMPDE